MDAEIYIGNLSQDTTENELRDLFSQAGSVTRAILIVDRSSGISKGMAFIQMKDRAAADHAVAMFNGRTISKRKLRVILAENR